MAQTHRITATTHGPEDKVPGKLLGFKDKSVYHVQKGGAYVRVVQAKDGKWHKPLKLTKKQRRKIRADIKARPEQ